MCKNGSESPVTRIVIINEVIYFEIAILLKIAISINVNLGPEAIKMRPLKP